MAGVERIVIRKVHDTDPYHYRALAAARLLWLLVWGNESARFFPSQASASEWASERRRIRAARSHTGPKGLPPGTSF